jgi:hypothetical protein
MSSNAQDHLPCKVMPNELYNATVALMDDEYDFHYVSSQLMYVWLETKDVRELASFIGIHSMGVFVRIVLRVANFIDEVKTVLLGLHRYELYNRLENHREKLFGGIITNSSLYVN